MKPFQVLPKYIYPLCFFFLVFACGKGPSDPVSAGLDYSDSSCWFEGNRAPRDKKVDIFYVGPTCIWDYTDSSGRRQHHMDVFDPRQRGLVDPSVRLAESVLSDSCNFFSPY